MHKVISLLLILALLSGCASFSDKNLPQEDYPGAGILPPYSGPKATIVVADFELKAAKASRQIGAGLQEMLVTALVNSNRFMVLERQALKTIRQEQELAASADSTPQKETTQKAKLKTADLVIAAVLSEFEPEASGGRAGVGGGGGIGSGTFGGLLGTSLNQAHIAIDIRIIETSTSRILAARRIEAQASDISGAIMKGFLGKWSLGSGLSVYANTPLEKAIRICIIEAVRYIARTVPENYYKH